MTDCRLFKGLGFKDLQCIELLQLQISSGGEAVRKS